jgi:hypothetical protein
MTLPNEKLRERRCPLMYRKGDRIKIKLEEDAWRALVVFHNTLVVSDAVLMRLQWLGPWSDVCRRHDMHEILVSHEI